MREFAPIERERSVADRNLGVVAAIAVPAASVTEDFKNPRRPTDGLEGLLLMAGWLNLWIDFDQNFDSFLSEHIE
jgi:hypothetical protein